MPSATNPVKSVLYPNQWPFFEKNAGKPFPPEYMKKVVKEVEEFCHILEGEGVTVQRPDIVDFQQVSS